jgi:hypothetical protein
VVIRLLLLILLIGGINSSVTGQTAGDYWLEVEISHDRPYVGETITYTVRYYAYNLDRIPNEPVIFPEFEHFWLGEIYESPPRSIVIENVQYYVGEIIFELIPLITGAITIAPSELILIETAYAPMISYPSAVITLDVRPLPDSPPENFIDGLVGQYNISFDINKLDAMVGDSLILTAEVISRMGNLDHLNLPKIILGDEWHVTNGMTYPTVQSAFNTALKIRKFEWRLIPLQSGLLTIDGLGLSYFDPIKGEYIEQPQMPIQVNVRGQGGFIIHPQINHQLALKTIPLEHDAFFYPHWLIWVIPLGIVCLIFFVQQYQAYRQRRDIYIRRRDALEKALKRAQNLTQHSLDELNRRTRSIIKLYLKDKGYPDHYSYEALDKILSLGDDLSYKPNVTADELQAFIARLQAVLREIDDREQA